MYGYWFQTKPISIRIVHQDLHLVSHTLLQSTNTWIWWVNVVSHSFFRWKEYYRSSKQHPHRIYCISQHYIEKALSAGEFCLEVIFHSTASAHQHLRWVRRHDDVIKWKRFPRNWPFVRGIHRSPVNSPQKGHGRGALMFSLICVWINGWVNNREAGDLRRNRAHFYVTVMISYGCFQMKSTCMISITTCLYIKYK